MSPTRLLLLAVIGCCLLRSEPLFADDIANPFNPAAQFTADLVITSDKVQNITSKMAYDKGKIRMDMSMQGMQTFTIVRPDLKKVYVVMVDQKMMMEMPYDPEKMKKQMMGATGPEGKYELVGPDTVDGVASTKYKVTNNGDKKVYFFWVDASSKIPVKMMAEDGSITMLWKNYKTGPPDASLFEPPTDYKVMAMPQVPGMPGGGGAPPDAGP